MLQLTPTSSWHSEEYFKMTASTIKSITTMRATGAGNNGNWVARMKMSDGTELFGGLNAGYTSNQASLFAQNNKTNTAAIDPFTRIEDDLPYQPLPAGVTVSFK
jgi:hypothetical protein